MRSAIHTVVFLSFAAWAVAGCVGEAPSPAGLQATQQSLQAKGVYYVRATGTAENAAFTFYDQNKAVIGDGRSSQDPRETEIRWHGNSWENTGSGFRKNGVAVGSNGLDAAELDTVLTVFELSLDQAFPPSSSQPNDQSQPSDQLQLTGPIHPNACIQVPCQRPLHRCTANCTGFVCSQTDGTEGICIHEG